MAPPLPSGPGPGPGGPSASTSAARLPPTGPKAMRAFNPPSGPSALHHQHPHPQQRVSIALPSPSRPVPSGPAAARMGARLHPQPRATAPAAATSLPSSSSSSSSLQSRLGPPPLANRHGLLGSSAPVMIAPASAFAGISSGSSYIHAESSRQAASAAARPLPPHLASSSGISAARTAPSPSPPTATEHHASSSSPPKPSTRRRSKSPSKRSHALAHAHAQSDEDSSTFHASFLPTVEAPRTKISFAMPALSNGLTRPRPPHLDISPFDKPPPPPDARPPTPPPDETIPPPPDDEIQPPPEDLLPPPPPSPPARSPSPLPPPPSSEPASVPLSPFPFPISKASSSRAPSVADDSRPPSPPHEESIPPPPPRPPPNGTSNGSLAPPPFHFRELPLRRPTPSDEDEESESTSSRSANRDTIPSPPPPPAEAPESPPLPPYVQPPYVPPPCVFHRPGIGNYTSHKGKDKEWVKRYDGMDGDVPVKVVDPRLSIPRDQLARGRGSMKVRTAFHDVDYEWDEYSTTPKPPPPPTAVLITGLSPLTTTEQISKFLRPHGRIKDIDAKMDTKSGMQLGICWVNFDGPPHGRQGTAHDVANQVVRVCDGQRISLTGDEKIRVVLDGRGLRTQKAVKDEMDRRYAPKPKPPVPTPASTSIPTPLPVRPMSAGTPSSAGAQTPRTEPSVGTPIGKSSLPPIPRTLGGPYASNRPYRAPPALLNPSALRNSTLDRSLPSRPVPSLPSRPTGLPVRPATAVQHLASSFTAAPFSHHAHRDRAEADRDRGRRADVPDNNRPGRRRSRSRSVSSYSSYSDYSSDSDYARPVYRARTKSPMGNRRRPGQRIPAAPSKEDEKAVERVKEALAENGHSHVFIDAKSLPALAVNEPYLKDHFRAFKPSSILYNHVGWHVLFSDDGAAYRAQRVLDKTAVQGHRLGLIVRAPASAKAVDDQVSTAMNGSNVEKGAWRLLTISKKNRPAPAPRKPSPKAVVPSAESSDDEAPVTARPRKRLPSFSSASSLSDEEVSVPSRTTAPTEAMDVDDEPLTPLPPADESTPIIIDEGEPELEVKDGGKGKKRPAKGKVGKQAKKARLASPVVELVPPVEPEVAEIKLDEEVSKKGAKAKLAKTKKPKAPRSEVDKFLEAAEVEDEEDAYWLGQALAAAKDGVEPTFSDDEDVEIDEKHPLYHTSGAWRAEGWKKIPQIQKSTYLPQRNRAAKSVEEASGVTTGRTARLAGRDQHRQTAAVASGATVESDLFAFNQLRIRKKQLRFARSAIEGYGLYAMETIHVGEMVCEYVGELCRAAVAEVREQRYLKQGIGSSYLFRIDNDIVCDATFKGSVSRLINHSCDPSANAKIIKVNGQSKIVIYAERTLHPGEEILYDYKFPLESDPALRVPCLCGAPTCRGWLN